MNKKSLSRRLLFVLALGFGMLSIQASQAQDTAKTATAPQVKFVTNMGEFACHVYSHSHRCRTRRSRSIT